MNLAATICHAVRQNPDGIALQDGEVRLTYAEFHRRAGQLAQELLALGVKPGDRIGAWLPNLPETVVLAYATWWVGGVFVPLNTRWSRAELRAAVNDARPRVLAVWEETRQAWGRDAWDWGPTLFGVRDPSSEDGWAWDRRKAGGISSGLPPITPRKDEDPALIMYTSGTTGHPKGVIQTHRNNTAAVALVQDAWEITRSDRFLVAVPLFHVGGMQCAVLPALASGAAVRLLSRWSADQWIFAARECRPTVTGLVTTMLVDLIRWGTNHAEDVPDLSDLRVAMMGGSPTPPSVVEQFRRVFGVSLQELYGQTELTGLAVTYRVGEPWRPGSFGRLMDQALEAAIGDPHGTFVHPIASPATGELWCRGETVSPGYWNWPEKTRERWRDGWYRTGDIVTVDSDGYFFYRDRVDDMIVTGGENVYPTEVESLLAEIPLIRHVAVIGTPHPRWGTEVTAVIVPQRPDVSREAVIQAIRQHPGISGYKRPRRIELVDELPKTGSGKVNKARLKELLSGSED